MRRLAILLLVAVAGCTPEEPATPVNKGPSKIATLVDSVPYDSETKRIWTWRFRVERQRPIDVVANGRVVMNFPTDSNPDNRQRPAEIEIKATFTTPYKAEPDKVLEELELIYYPGAGRDPGWRTSGEAKITISDEHPMYKLANSWEGGDRPFDKEVALVTVDGRPSIWLVPR